MTTRRRLLGSLCGAAALLLAAAVPAVAQDGTGRAAAAAASTEPAAGSVAATPRKPRQARKRPRPSIPAQGPQQAAPSPYRLPDTEHRLDAAPVPNRDLEGPRAPVADRTRLSPSVIHRRLPSQGMATEGAASIQEERLFFPAPGARLNVPFSY